MVCLDGKKQKKKLRFVIQWASLAKEFEGSQVLIFIMIGSHLGLLAHDIQFHYEIMNHTMPHEDLKLIVDGSLRGNSGPPIIGGMIKVDHGSLI